jgi:hypothetical protein
MKDMPDIDICSLFANVPVRFSRSTLGCRVPEMRAELADVAAGLVGVGRPKTATTDGNSAVSPRYG